MPWTRDTAIPRAPKIPRSGMFADSGFNYTQKENSAQSSLGYTCFIDWPRETKRYSGTAGGAISLWQLVLTALLIGGVLIPVVITLNPPRIERAEVKAAGFDDTASGNLDIGTTWGGACAAFCVEGTDYPGASDTAVIDTGTVTLTANHNVSSTTVAT